MANTNHNRAPHECRIRELAAAAAPMQVDEEKSIVFGVKILGERSINPPPDNNIYRREVREKAIAALEGARAHVDHWKDEPSYKDSFGVHRNVRESGTGLLSDVHCNPHHPITKQFIWDAKNNPRNVGFSLNTSATKRWTEDGMVVESINFSPVHHSVDLVHHGATTQSLTESAKGKTMATKTITEILSARKQPWQIIAYAKLREQAGEMMDATAVDLPADADADGQIDEAFKKMIAGVLDDASLDIKGKLQKIKDILVAQEKLMAKSEPAPEAAAETPPEPAAEKAKVPVATPVKPDKSALILNALVSESVAPNKYLTRALAGCETEAEMKETITDWKKRVKESATEPEVKSGARTQQQTNLPPVPATVQEAARAWYAA